MPDRPPWLILLCGLPGAGKTAAARRTEAQVPAVRLCPDEWLADLGIDLFDQTTRVRLEAVFWRLAQDLLRVGTSVVLESGFWRREDRDEKRQAAHALGATVELVYLDVPFDERWRRIERRNAGSLEGTVRIERDQLAGYDQLFEPPDDDELALFDLVYVRSRDRPPA